MAPGPEVLGSPVVSLDRITVLWFPVAPLDCATGGPPGMLPVLPNPGMPAPSHRQLPPGLGGAHPSLQPLALPPEWVARLKPPAAPQAELSTPSDKAYPNPVPPLTHHQSRGPGQSWAGDRPPQRELGGQPGSSGDRPQYPVLTRPSQAG